MSDDTTNYDDIAVLQMPGDDDPDGLTKDDVSPKDPVLNLLLSNYVGFDDEANGSIGLTIQCGGITVSGMVISETEWTSRMSQQLRDGGSPEFADEAEKAFLRMLKERAEGRQRRDAADLLGKARRFIHMRDVKLLIGMQKIDSPLWRGSLKDISGWSIGTWQPNAASAD